MATSSVRVVLYGTDASLSRVLAKAGIAARAAGDEIEGMGGKSSAFSKLAGLGKVALIGIAAAGAAVGAVSIRMGADFQASMELLRTQAGASQAEVDSMSKSVLALAGPTATAPLALSQALFHIESTGARGAKALQELKIAAEGARVGQANLTDVTNALNATVVSGISGIKTTSAAMGILNATVGAGDMHMEDLAEALGTGILPTLKGFGVSMQSVGGALATFGDNNIRGADAATALRMAVMALAKPAAGPAAVDALNSIGLSTTALGKTMSEHGLNAAVQELSDKLKAAGDTGGKVGQIMTIAFGKKAGIGLTTLVSQVTRFQQKTAEVATGASTFGADWTATTKTLSFQVDQLKATGDELATRLGLALIPKLEQLAQVTDQVVQWFEKHTAVAKLLAVAIGSVLVVAIGVYTVAAAQAAIATVAATWPFLAVIGVIAAVGVGIYELITHWNDVTAFIQRDSKWIMLAVYPIVGPIELVLRAAIALADNWTAVFNRIKAVTLSVWNTALHPIFSVVADFLEVTIADPLRILGALFAAQFRLISGAVQLAWRYAGPVLSAFVKDGLAPLDDAVSDIGAAFTLIWGGIESDVQDAWAVIKPILSTMSSALKDVDSAAGKVKSIAGKATGGVTGALGHIGVHVGATGGIVTQPTLAVIGEAGPEIVVPIGSLDSAPGARPLMPSRGRVAGGGGTTVSAQPLVIQVVLDGKVIGKSTHNYLLDLKNHGYRIGLA